MIDSIEELVRQFDNRSLPKAEWTHHAHQKVCLAYIDRYDAATIPGLLRERISRYNEASGGVNSDTMGYHETITMFWLCVLLEFMKEGKFSDLGDAFTALLETPINSTNYILEFYSKELISTTEARKNWVKPDKKEYPTFGLFKN